MSMTDGDERKREGLSLKLKKNGEIKEVFKRKNKKKNENKIM